MLGSATDPELCEKPDLEPIVMETQLRIPGLSNNMLIMFHCLCIPSFLHSIVPSFYHSITALFKGTNYNLFSRNVGSESLRTLGRSFVC